MNDPLRIDLALARAAGLPNIARMIDVQQRAVLAEVALYAGMPLFANEATRPAPLRPVTPFPDARRAWPWLMFGETTIAARGFAAFAPLCVGVAAALVLGRGYSAERSGQLSEVFSVAPIDWNSARRRAAGHQPDITYTAACLRRRAITNHRPKKQHCKLKRSWA